MTPDLWEYDQLGAPDHLNDAPGNVFFDQESLQQSHDVRKETAAEECRQPSCSWIVLENSCEQAMSKPALCFSNTASRPLVT